MKKTISMLLALTMVATLFVGCGPRNNPTAGTTTGTTGHTETTGMTTIPTTHPNGTTPITTTPTGTEPMGTTDNTTPATVHPAAEVINKIYEKVNYLELPLMEPTEVDLKDTENITYYTGLKDTSKIKSVHYSESAMGSQAYSLVVVTLAEGADAEAVAKEMRENIDTRKWVCVEADEVQTAVADDMVILVMVDTNAFGKNTATDLVNAFKEIRAK